MVALSSIKILMTKMMKKQMLFMKLLMKGWMKREESTETKGSERKLKSTVRRDPRFNNSLVT